MNRDYSPISLPRNPGGRPSPLPPLRLGQDLSSLLSPRNKSIFIPCIEIHLDYWTTGILEIHLITFIALMMQFIAVYQCSPTQLTKTALASCSVGNSSRHFSSNGSCVWPPTNAIHTTTSAMAIAPASPILWCTLHAQCISIHLTEKKNFYYSKSKSNQYLACEIHTLMMQWFCQIWWGPMQIHLLLPVYHLSIGICFFFKYQYI